MIREVPATIVLKFGSSVLRTQASLPVAVTEVYRHYRSGERVIAVVSAFEGVTDSLLASVPSKTPDAASLVALLSTGEITSAAQLSLSLHEAGISAHFIDPRDLGLIATGDRVNATLSRVSLDKAHARLAEHSVLVVPGFFAAHEDGGLALLGRGGSDLTALFLASELRARCVLLKDVDGLYESDPAEARRSASSPYRTPPRRFALADYATAESLAGPLVQAKSIRFARERALPLDVSSVGSSLHTRIGEGPDVHGPTKVMRPIRVALLGLGTVGRGVLEYLERFPERFDVVAALVRHPEKHAAGGARIPLLTRSADEVFAREPEIVVEALPGLEPARSCVGRALRRDLLIVTANKALIAAEWKHLSPYLAGPRRLLRYAGAVGGSVPMLETLERLILRTRIVRLRGVLNGTANFVLDRCATGDPFATAVRSAQEEGFAEADSTEDLSGRDSERKLWILSQIAFGGPGACESLAGIDESSCFGDARLPRGRVRLVAEAERTADGFRYRVSPQILEETDFLASTRGAENRLEITTVDGTVHRLQGAGAGRVPTATAVFADVLDHARIVESDDLVGSASALATA